MSALLPCPFCGETPRLERPAGTAHIVLCGNCGASCDYYEPKADAIAAWNRRTPPAGAGEAVPFESMRAKRVNVHDASLGWVAHTPRCEHRFDKDQANVWNAALASAATATLAAPTPLPEAVRELPGKWLDESAREIREEAGNLAGGYSQLAREHGITAKVLERVARELDRALTGGDKQGDSSPTGDE